MVLATQNPIDLEGTYPLPEAQIDRFLVRVSIGYPSAKDEVMMLRTHNAEPPHARAVLGVEDLLSLQAIARRVHVEDDLYEYAVGLTTFTRSHARVLLGASPRATLGLVQAAKSAAVIAGRPFVTPDDMRGVASAVLAHRLVLVPEAEGDQRARDAVIDDALQRVGYRRAVRPV
jgi:MoxR-like ATPase